MTKLILFINLNHFIHFTEGHVHLASFVVASIEQVPPFMQKPVVHVVVESC